MHNCSPTRCLKTNPEVIRLAVKMYFRFPLSLRKLEDLLHVRCIYICHETVRFWWLRFGPMFAADIVSVVADIRAEGARSLRAIATQLNVRGMVTRRGGTWQVSNVKGLLDRLDAAYLASSCAGRVQLPNL